MTKTFPDCDATVLSTSQPERMGIAADFLSIVRSAYYSGPTGPQEEAWNSACEHIEEGLVAALAATPAANAEAIKAIRNTLAMTTDEHLAATPAVGGEDARTEALRVISTMAICEEGETAEQRALIVDACREVAANALAAQPASPLLADEPTTFEKVRQIAFRLSAHQQYRLAFLISENIGYALKSNDPLAELSVDGHPLAGRGDVA